MEALNQNADEKKQRKINKCPFPSTYVLINAAQITYNNYVGNN
jgi:hypothetical protein